jgi:hypothetical protein
MWAAYANLVKEHAPQAQILFDRFHIVKHPKAFADPNVQRRIASLSSRTQARIKGAQPYNRPHSQLPPLLRLLADFDNIDKHRLLNVVIANVSGGKFSFRPNDDQRIFIPPTIEFLGGPVESGAEFAWFTINPPERDMDYDDKASFVISIAHAAGPSGRTFGELGYILEILITEVKRIVEEMIL